MLHRHLQDVRLLQFRVSGALRGRKTRMVRITRSLSRCLTAAVWMSINKPGGPLSAYNYIFFERIQDESFQLAQALVDPGSSPLFHNWLG